MERELIVVQPNLKGLPEPLAYYDPELQNAWNEDAANPKRLERAVVRSRKLRAAYLKQLSSLRSRVNKRTYRLFSADRDPLFDSNLFEFTFGDYLGFATRLRKVRPHVEIRAAFLSFEEDTLHELRYGGIQSLRVNVPDERWFERGGNEIDSLLAHELLGAGKELMQHTCLFVSGTSIVIRCGQLSWSKRPFAVDKSPYH
jgi:hypothetical protein